MGKKRVAFVIPIIMLMIINVHVQVQAEGAAESKIMGGIIENQGQTAELKKVNETIRKSSIKDMEDILPGYDPEKIIDNLTKGNVGFDIPGFIENLAKYAVKEILNNIDVIIKVLIIAALCALLKALKTSFLSESVGELAFYSCYIVMISLMVASFSTAVKMVGGVINDMVSFMQAMVPPMISILAASGNVVSAGIFQPMLIMGVELAAVLMRDFIIPLIYLTFIMSIVENISDNIQVAKISEFLKQLNGWCTGIILTLFVSVMAIQGTFGAAVDGVTSKTAKFAIGTFVPVVGKYLADAADAVVGCTMLIRNAAGIAAMVSITLICLIPLLKVFALLMLYRIGGIIIEPISDRRMVNCINSMGNSLTHMMGVLSSVALMFLISLAAVVGAGNISAMYR